MHGLAHDQDVPHTADCAFCGNDQRRVPRQRISPAYGTGERNSGGTGDGCSPGTAVGVAGQLRAGWAAGGVNLVGGYRAASGCAQCMTRTVWLASPISQVIAGPETW